MSLLSFLVSFLSEEGHGSRVKKTNEYILTICKSPFHAIYSHIFGLRCSLKNHICPMTCIQYYFIDVTIQC